ncbi:MAG TPA: nucleoside deaminase [Candidatus Paceibacterota bacterium]
MLDDNIYLQLALDGARKSLADGNFPVGAVLVIDGKLVGTARNLIRTNTDWVSHAEAELMREHARLIKESRKAGCDAILYTSFEPCLMCLGMATLSRISRIVYSCPDPYTGATSLTIDSLPEIYATLWPKIERGPLKDESKSFILEALTTPTQDPKWSTMIELLKGV